MTSFGMADYAATFTGKRINLDEPNSEDFSIVDIALGLAQQCRYSGQTWPFYSIAEHSIMVAFLCWDKIKSSNPLIKKRIGLLALMHDSPEFIINDMIRPVKRRVHGYDAIESRILFAICKKFGLEYREEDWKLIKEQDDLITIVEREQLMKALDRGEYGKGVDVSTLPDVCVGNISHPPLAALRFLDAYCHYRDADLQEEDKKFRDIIKRGY